MSELLKSAISEIDYALVSNKGGKEVREHYLNNAKRYINEAEKEQQIQLNADQIFVFEWLKKYIDADALRLNPIATVFELNKRFEDSEDDLVNVSYFRLNEKEEFQVLQAFAEWGLSDECKKNI